MRTTPSGAVKPAALLLGAALWAGAAGAAPNGPAAAPGGSGLEGLWEGVAIYQRAEVELEVTVEIGRAADGRLVGTADMPNQQIAFHPLDSATLEGNKGSFAFTWYFPHAEQNVTLTFTGTLAADGQSFTGELVESDDPQARRPFTMRRLGDPGMPRPQVRRGKLEPLSPAGAELKEAFNRDAGKTRLVMLLSPT